MHRTGTVLDKGWVPSNWGPLPYSWGPSPLFKYRTALLGRGEVNVMILEYYSV